MAKLYGQNSNCHWNFKPSLSGLGDFFIRWLSRSEPEILAFCLSINEILDPKKSLDNSYLSNHATVKCFLELLILGLVHSKISKLRPILNQIMLIIDIHLYFNFMLIWNPSKIQLAQFKNLFEIETSVKCFQRLQNLSKCFKFLQNEVSSI